MVSDNFARKQIQMIMKRIISSIVLCGLSVCSWAQSAMSPGESFSSTSEPIDRIRYEILYDLRQVYDRTPGNNKSISERMLLQVGDSSSAFFSYLAFQVDSVIFAMSDKEGSFEINAIPKVSWQYYKNYPTVGKSMFLDKVAMSGFAVEEQMNTPDWTLIADSSKAILGYDCRLAVANFKGRTWYAWYAENIPIDNGPWKLQGLPGLVLSANDSDNEFVFKAVGLKNVQGGAAIVYKGKDFELISRKALNKVYKQYFSDPIGYTLMIYPASVRNSITITDGNGNALKHSKAKPYNLIEW
ncbi:hypothetical protein GCM10019997_13490 [Prevotella corporis]